MKTKSEEKAKTQPRSRNCLPQVAAGGFSASIVFLPFFRSGFHSPSYSFRKISDFCFRVFAPLRLMNVPLWDVMSWDMYVPWCVPAVLAADLVAWGDMMTGGELKTMTCSDITAWDDLMASDDMMTCGEMMTCNDTMKWDEMRWNDMNWHGI